MTIDEFTYAVFKFGIIVSFFGIPYALYTSNYDAAVMFLIVLGLSLYMFWDANYKDRE